MFNVEWLTYNPLNFADTFLPKVDLVKGNGLWIYDGAKLFEGIEKIVKKFYQFSNVQQVPVDELLKNPFKHEILLASARKFHPAEQKGLQLDYETAKQLWLKQQAENMQLFTIMQSQEGICCMIDDKILYEGDLIKGFKVRQISDNHVKLESEGVQILLKLSE